MEPGRNEDRFVKALRHLDLYTHNLEGEVERLVKTGAVRYPWRYRPGSDFIVLEDPDGNLFCVVQIATAS